MKFMIDECVGPSVALWLKAQGFDTVSVYDGLQGIDDDTVLNKAWTENRILITSDKDFGDLVFRQQKNFHGIILLRLTDESFENKIKVIQAILETHSEEIEGSFVSATEKMIRIVSRIVIQ